MTFTMDLQFKYKCVATPDEINGQESEFSLVVNLRNINNWLV